MVNEDLRQAPSCDELKRIRSLENEDEKMNELATCFGFSYPEDTLKRKRKRIRKKKVKEAPLGDSKENSENIEEFLDRDTPKKDSNDTVYVEGIPYSATKDDLIAFFASCGGISDIRMPTFQDSGKPMGYAHVAFDSSEGFLKFLPIPLVHFNVIGEIVGLLLEKQALEKNGDFLGGRYLKIEVSHAKDEKRIKTSATIPEGCKTVFVKNLPYDADEEMVKTAFVSCGKVNNVRLAIWNNTKQRKGFGYVDFGEEGGAQNAVKNQSAINIGGRQVLVDFDSGKPKGSFRLADGRKYEKVIQETKPASTIRSGATLGTAKLTGKEWRKAMFGKKKKTV